MATMTIRGIDDEVAKLLKERAKTEGMSVNALLSKMVKESLGIEEKRRIKIYHDLDHLAGTWSEKDLKEFQKNVEYLEKIDEEIWRK
ncbi:MAG: antitoxin [Candidatus Brocadia sp.]|jgi:plasmid stability protein